MQYALTFTDVPERWGLGLASRTALSLLGAARPSPVSPPTPCAIFITYARAADRNDPAAGRRLVRAAAAGRLRRCVGEAGRTADVAAGALGASIFEPGPGAVPRGDGAGSDSPGLPGGRRSAPGTTRHRKTAVVSAR